MSKEAFAICWMDEVNRVGEFEPVGTHADFRRRGLERAVLLEGMRLMQMRGAATAFVMCDGDSELAARLYESVGFHTVKKDYDYVREDLCHS